MPSRLILSNYCLDHVRDENLRSKGYLRVNKALFTFRADNHVAFPKEPLSSALSQRNLRRPFGVHTQNEPVAQL